MDFYMTVRKATVAPVLADCFLAVVWFCRREIFSGAGQLLYSLAFLGLLPLLAYPLQRFIPGVRNKGRAGQRILAMIFSFAGYLLGCAVNLLAGASDGLWVIYLLYLFSSLLILVLNKAFGLKASGHACGVFGPTLLLIYFGLYPAAAAGLTIAALVYTASIRTGRHTLPQLIGGSLVPCVIMAVLWALF